MRFGMLGWVLMPLLAVGKATQQPSAPQSSDAQPSTSQAASPQPANPKSIKPSAVAAAADASRQARDSSPPIKVIRNDDLNDDADSPETANSEPKPNDATAQHKLIEDKTTRDEERKVRQFYAQGLTFKNQVKVQKGKIADIQNRMTSLKNQFAAWSAGFAQDSEAQACWTSTYYTPYLQGLVRQRAELESTIRTIATSTRPGKGQARTNARKHPPRRLWQCGL
jgi:hypothetical protein